VAPAFSVTVNDGTVDSNTLAATVTYNPQNDAPVLDSASLTVSEGQTVTLAPGNFGITDPDNSAFTYSVSGVSGGYFQLSSAPGTPVTTFTSADLSGGLVQFVDDGNEVAPAFSVTVNDGAADSNTLAAAITYNPQNDAPTTTPVTLAPIAEDSGARLITQAELLANAADVDGGPLTATGLVISAGGGTLVDNGDGTWSYTPAADDDTSVSFTYTIGDGQGGSTGGAATLDIIPVNDAPTTNDASASGLEDAASIAITLTGTDVEGPVDHFALTDLPASGTLYLDAALTTPVQSNTDYAAADGQLTLYFVPDADWNGSTTFQYSAHDGQQADPTPATATLTVAAVNDAPRIVSDGGGASASLALTENLADVTTVTGADVDADAIRYSIEGGADAALFGIDPASGVLTFNQAPDYERPGDANADNVYELVVRADDGRGASALQALSLVIGNANEDPTAAADDLTTTADQSLLITSVRLLENDLDVDGDALAVVAVTAPAFGAIAQDAAGEWRYTPAAGFSGTDTFRYTVADPGGRTATAEVRVLVTAATPLPVPDELVSDPVGTSGSGTSAPSKSTDESGAAASGGAGAESGGTADATPDAPALGTAPETEDGSSGQVSEPSLVWPSVFDEASGPQQIVATEDPVAGFFAAVEADRVYEIRPWTSEADFSSKSAIDQLLAGRTALGPQTLRALAQFGTAEDLRRSISAFTETFSDVLGEQRRVDREVAQVMIGSGLTLSAGVVAWLLRGGALAASLLSALPAWTAFDPIPILVRRRQDKETPAPNAAEDVTEAAIARVLRPDAVRRRGLRS
jgi:hypothetical protein